MSFFERASLPASGRMETYTLAVHVAEEGGFWGEVLELPGCGSQGESIDELLENIVDAIQGVLEVHLEDEGSHPKENIITMSVSVPVPQTP